MIFFLIFSLSVLKLEFVNISRSIFLGYRIVINAFRVSWLAPKCALALQSVFLAKLLAACTTFVFEKMHLNFRKVTITNFVVNITHFCHSRRS